jgi:hypothetical protein
LVKLTVIEFPAVSAKVHVRSNAIVVDAGKIPSVKVLAGNFADRVARVV